MSMTGEFSSKQLTIVGLGLMGGSLALALREHAERIVGIDPNPEARAYAIEQGIVDEATDQLQAGVSQADTVILCAPVTTVIDVVKNRIGAYLRSNTLLIDIGSTKKDICEVMGRLPIGIHAIGGHPMTGKELSGITASDKMLYVQRPFVLCSTRRTTPATRIRALALVEALQALPIEMDAARHDRVVAAISHLPYLLSISLVATVAAEAENDPAVWQLAAGGFRDTSRLAGSDLKMMTDILSTNTQAIATLLAMFRVQMGLLETKLISQDSDKLLQALAPIREARLTWATRKTTT
ncbi:MAG: prephenate dehydrogenase/arogenate dehydrogenase family protein [Anaerolineae bacterium]|nr:prephenate dehydrogenase/arogenate dehydrogenase family protein [Anaerolineae bacterium]